MHLSPFFLLLVVVSASTSVVPPVWPMPSSIQTVSTTCLRMDPSDFSFNLMNASFTSDVLKQAFTQYRNLTFLSSAPWYPPEICTNIKGSLLYLSISVASFDETLGPATDETYTLTTTLPAQLSAKSVYGVLRGLETFSQLLDKSLSGEYSIPQVEIVDSPRYGFRAIMIDTARFFRPVAEMKQMIDAMQYNKFNALLIHFTDNGSWTVQVKAFPLLTTNCSTATDFQVYSQDDVAEMVSYARLRGVRVIYEVDSPGHFDTEHCYPDLLTLANYPCPGAGPGHGTFRSDPDPSNPDFWNFLTQVHRELTAVMPDDYVNMGTDEAWLSPWGCSTAVAAWMTAQNFTSIGEVASWYTHQVKLTLDSLHKRPMTWSPGMLDNGQEPTAIHLVWSGWPTNGGSWRDDFTRFTSRGEDVVLSGPWYLDDASNFTTYYRINPANFTTNVTLLGHVLGGMGTIWSDINKADMYQRAWPLMNSVAEVLWSPESFTQSGAPIPVSRAADQRARMLARGLPVG